MEYMYGVTRNPYTKRYFRSAADYFRSEAEDQGKVAAFLYVSDDMQWGRDNLGKKKKNGDFFFVGKYVGDV